MILPFALFCQQGYSSNFYFSQMSFFNPAYVGSSFKSEASFISRNQWTSVENSPQSQFLTLSSPRKNNIGLGFSAFTKKNFIERRTLTYLDFSYKLQLNDDRFIFLGLKGGVNFFKADLVSLTDQNLIIDPALENNATFNPNIGVGFLFKSPKYYFSFSIPRIFSGSNNNFQTRDALVNTFIAAGFNTVLTSNLGVESNIMFTTTKGFKNILDFNAMIRVNDAFKIGANYRSNNTMSPLVLLNIKNFKVGYSYEFQTNNSFGSLGLKTHELFLKIDLNYQSLDESGEQAEED